MTYALADAVPVILVLERDAGIQTVGLAERLGRGFVRVAVGAPVAAGGFGGGGGGGLGGGGAGAGGRRGFSGKLGEGGVGRDRGGGWARVGRVWWVREGR